MVRTPGPLAAHSVQLASVWVAEASSRRRGRQSGDADGPTFTPTAFKRVALTGEGAGFSGDMTISIFVPVLEEDVFEASIRLVAHFGLGRPVTLSVARGFLRRQGLYLLWPFARGYFDQLGSISGLGIPPLPLLLVPAAAAAP